MEPLNVDVINTTTSISKVTCPTCNKLNIIMMADKPKPIITHRTITSIDNKLYKNDIAKIFGGGIKRNFPLRTPLPEIIQEKENTLTVQDMRLLEELTTQVRDEQKPTLTTVIVCKKCKSDGVQLRQLKTINSRCSTPLYDKLTFECGDCKKKFFKLAFKNLPAKLLFMQIIQSLPPSEKKYYKEMICE